jgi:UDP-glucose 4-epimerase
MAILVTGGTGYIGSHTCVELLNEGYEIIVVDNLSNSNIVSLHRIQELTGKIIKFYNVDLMDKDSLETIFLDNKIDDVIHFARYKAVGELVLIPLSYYHNTSPKFPNRCLYLLQKKFVSNNQTSPRADRGYFYLNGP